MSRERLVRALLVLLAALGATLPARAARADDERPTRTPPLTFVWDPKLGTEAGVRTFDSLGRMLFRYDEALPPLVRFDEQRAGGRFLGTVGRVAQLLFVDSALAVFESTVVHEVFGHGSRARDLRQTAQFQFALPGIYCSILGDGDNCTSFTSSTRTSLHTDGDTLITAGGLEANYFAAHLVEQRMVRSGGWLHQGDLLVYGVSKAVYGDSFLSSSLGTAGSMKESNDVSAYVSNLQDRFNRPRPEDRRSIANRLRVAYVWNLLDPLVWYSLYASIANGIVRGQRWSKVPLPTLGGTTLLATPRFGLTPFGAEHYVDVFAARGTAALSVYGRVGSSGLASYTGAGARLVGVPVTKRVDLGGELDVWSQPEILLHDRGVYDRPQRRGLNLGATADVRLWKTLGLTGRLAYKTDGFLAGQPVTEGVYGYLGVRVDAP